MVSAVSSRRYFEEPLVGENCALRNATLDDAENLTNWRNVSRIAFFDSRPVTIEQTRRFLENADGYHFIVEHEGQSCGYISTYDIDMETGMATVGRSVIQPERRGRSILVEARRLATVYVFMHEPTIRKLCGVTRRDNPSGLRFNLNVGQEFEGIRRFHYLERSTGWMNGAVYSCLKDRYLEDFDWQARCYRHPDPLSETIRKFLGV